MPVGVQGNVQPLDQVRGAVLHQQVADPSGLRGVHVLRYSAGCARPPRRWWRPQQHESPGDAISPEHRDQPIGYRVQGGYRQRALPGADRRGFCPDRQPPAPPRRTRFEAVLRRCSSAGPSRFADSCADLKPAPGRAPGRSGPAGRWYRRTKPCTTKSTACTHHGDAHKRQ